MATKKSNILQIDDLTIEIFEEPYDKSYFYSLMGESFALKSVRKEAPYLDNEPGRVWFVAIQNKPVKHVIGFVSLQEETTKIILKNDYVYPEYRRKGVYNALNEKRLEYAKSFGKPIAITAIKECSNYYKRLGFKITNSLAKYDTLLKEQ